MINNIKVNRHIATKNLLTLLTISLLLIIASNIAIAPIFERAYAIKEFDIDVEIEYNEIKRGDTQHITVTVKNDDTDNRVSDANVKLTVYPPDSESTSAHDETNNNGEETFDVKIDDKAETGIYDVDIRVSKDGYDTKTVNTSFDVVRSSGSDEDWDEDEGYNGSSSSSVSSAAASASAASSENGDSDSSAASSASSANNSDDYDDDSSSSSSSSSAVGDAAAAAAAASGASSAAAAAAGNAAAAAAASGGDASSAASTAVSENGGSSSSEAAAASAAAAAAASSSDDRHSDGNDSSSSAASSTSEEDGD
jgi:hypothetical protein